jgi:cytochrome c oxidase subunit 3
VSTTRPATVHPTGEPAAVSVGMVLFLGSELMFFSALFAMYFTLRAQAGPGAWPPPGVTLDTARTGVFTAVLVASSFTMQRAVDRVRGGDRAGMVRWLWLTVVLGGAFLAGQGWSYATADFQISSSAYGSAFYVMTGFHALHVFAGLVVMLAMLGRAAAGGLTARDHGGLEATAYYWHFVDVVWIALFTTLYFLR